MKSRIAQSIDLKLNPVAIILADEEPKQSLRFKPGKFGCVMFLFANAAKGKTVAFEKETYGCWGGGVGLGFGNAYQQFPGGEVCFAHFLSSGNEQWETGRAVGKAVEEHAGKAFADDFLKGERYRKTPELVHDFIAALPITEIPAKYVLFKPLGEVDLDRETPRTVVFVVDADQLSALVILANYGRKGIENVIIPWAAGCQTIGILPYAEGDREHPRAVVGLTDMSARKAVRKTLGKDHLSFAMPWRLFQEMEENVPGSFLECRAWASLQDPEQ
ncbi:Uncharacterised ArCR, COG2043 [Desulfonatronum zhilinae]|nr:Uncharacterised ArCR, COG2043 [Desulfonatronum zhilinae]